MAVDCLHAKAPTVSRPNRAAARHARPPHLANPCLGAAPRLRHRAGDCGGQRRASAGRDRLAVPRLASTRASGLDHRALGADREQAARQGVPADTARAALAGRPALALGGDRRRHRGRAARALGGDLIMSLRKERDLREEFEFHRRMAAADRGPSLGNDVLAADVTREQWRGYRWRSLAASLLRDVEAALRAARRQPVQTALALLVLVLGIGGTTALFSIVNAVLLRPLPYAHPDRLVAVELRAVNRGGMISPLVSLDEVERWRADARTLSSVGSFVFLSDPVQVGARALELRGIAADPELLETLGVQPLLGRNLPGRGSTVKNPVALISYRLWQDAFAGDMDVVGKGFSVDGSVVTVIGVLARNFQFPRSDASFFAESPDLIIPVANIADMWGRSSAQWFAFGRMRPGETPASVQQELAQISMAVNARGLQSVEPAVVNLQAATTAAVRPMLLLVFLLSLLLLLIACGNIMNLLFTSAAERRQEWVVRRALGATTGRIVGQLLTECAVLALIAGALALLAARGLLRTALAIWPAHLPASGPVALNAAAFGYALSAVVAVVLLAGMLPAWRASRARDLRPTQGSSPGANLGMQRTLMASQIALGLALLACAGVFTHSLLNLDAVPSGYRIDLSSPGANLGMQRTLMASQIALGLALLACAGVFTHSLLNLDAVPSGYRIDRTLSFGLSYPGVRQPDLPAIEARVLAAVRSTPGVAAAAAVTNPPPSPRTGMFAGVGTPRGNFVLNHQLISDGYFDAAGIPLLRGRDLTLHDNAGALQVAVINQALARIAFPGRDALGAAISTSLDGNRPRTVVGIVADAHDRGPAVVPMPTLYLSELQIPRGYGGMLVRFTAAPSVVAREIQRRIAAVDPAIPVSDVMTTAARLDQTLASPRFYAGIALAFGGAALLFVALGLYALVAYSGALRMRELAVRSALGASRGRILWLVLREGAGPALAGAAAGLVLALLATRSLAALLFRVAPVDAPALAWVAAAVV